MPIRSPKAHIWFSWPERFATAGAYQRPLLALNAFPQTFLKSIVFACQGKRAGAADEVVKVPAFALCLGVLKVFNGQLAALTLHQSFLIEGVGLSIVEDIEDGGEGLLRGRGNLASGCKVGRVPRSLVSFRRTFDIMFTRA